MRHIFVIALILSIVVNANCAEGRRTNFVTGLVIGGITGFIVHDAIVAKPAPTVVRVESAPVVETRVVYVRSVEVKHVPEYVIIDGKAYEVVRATPKSTFCVDNGWQPVPTHRLHGLDR